MFGCLIAVTTISSIGRGVVGSIGSRSISVSGSLPSWDGGNEGEESQDSECLQVFGNYFTT